MPTRVASHAFAAGLLFPPKSPVLNVHKVVPSASGPPDPVPTAKVGSLELMATNEYGEYDRRAASLYGLDMVVEPFKETTITVLNPTEVSKACK